MKHTKDKIFKNLQKKKHIANFTKEVAKATTKQKKQRVLQILIKLQMICNLQMIKIVYNLQQNYINTKELLRYKRRFKFTKAKTCRFKPTRKEVANNVEKNVIRQYYYLET